MRNKKARSFFTWSAPPASSYEINDFRSHNFRGIWVRHYINEVIDEYRRSENIYKTISNHAKVKHEHMPEKVYKFFPCSVNSLHCLENEVVYLNSPEYFNDPYDCYIASNELDFLKRYVLEQVKTEKMVENGIISQDQENQLYRSVCYDVSRRSSFEYRESINSAINNISLNNSDSKLEKCLHEAIILYNNSTQKLRNKDIRVASFSALDELKLSTYTEMWGHYADSSTGFCVEYDLSKFMDINSYESENYESRTVLGSFLPCMYQAKPYVIPPTYFYKLVTNKPLTKYQHAQYEKNIIKSFITKSSAWSYECEWRIILPPEYCKLYNNLISFPYASKIYLGYRMKESHKESVFNIAKRLNIEVYETKIREDAFELDFSCMEQVSSSKDLETMVRERKIKELLQK